MFDPASQNAAIANNSTDFHARLLNHLKLESVISPLLSPSSPLHHPMNRERRQVRGAEHRRGPFQIELLSSSPASNRIDEIPPVRLLSPSKEFSMLAIVVYREWSKFLKKDSIVNTFLFIYFSSSRLWLRGKWGEWEEWDRWFRWNGISNVREVFSGWKERGRNRVFLFLARYSSHRLIQNDDLYIEFRVF